MAIFQTKLLEKKHLQHDVVEFHFKKPEGWSFVSGQYTNLILPASLNLPAEHRARRFSPVDAPSDPHLIVSTRISSAKSPYKKALMDLEIGTEIRVGSPQGVFVLPNESSQKIIFIAGGIGITPFLSMLRDPRSAGFSIRLFYLNYSVQTAAYLDELTAFNLTHIETNTLSHPHEAFSVIEQTVLNSPDWLDGLFYLCGSPAMVHDTEQFLKKQLEIPENLIKTEEFTGY